MAPNRAPVGNNFTQQTARMVWVANPEVQFTPFRGKLAIFQKIFVDADAYLHAGTAFIGLNERGPCGASGQLQCSDPGAFAMVSRVAIAPSFGLGLSFYPADFISIGIEYRAIPFAWNRAGFDTRGGGPDGRFPDGKVDGNDATFAFNQFFSLQVGFFPQKRGTSE